VAVFVGIAAVGTDWRRSVEAIIGRAFMPKSNSGSRGQKASPIRDPLNKSQLLNALADNTGLARKEVAAVLDELGTVIHRHLKKRGAGQFTMPGLFKIKTTRKPATKARKGINPFTGEETIFKAKPARTVVKVQPLKGLKEMVQ
jgi:nucleoid DNA-binding protein